MDNVIQTFKEKRRAKEMRYQRGVLKEITPKLLKDRFAAFRERGLTDGITMSQVLEEGCYDVAIESYLLGANFSKFGYFGEPEEIVKERCKLEEKHLVDTMFNFLLYWGKISDFDMYNEGLYFNCGQYVDGWWKEGFNKGKQRYKLRLH